MAQMDGISKINTTRSPKTPRGRNSPTFEQLLQGDATKWPSCSSPTLAKEHEQTEDFFGHQNKKPSSSVITKVKEKAKRLRQSLSKKKHGHGHDHDGTDTPPWGVTLDEDDHDGKDEDTIPEYLGAPMYESDLAPKSCKETIRKHPRANLLVSEKHILIGSATAENENENKNENGAKQKKNETETATDASCTIPSKMAGLSIATNNISGDGLQKLDKGGQQTWDKGVSVKEYLWQKFEPGEGEKALSQVITEAISPRKTPDEMGVVDKVKEAVTSLLRNEDSASQPQPQPTITAPTPSIPISTFPQPETEEENHGRILQTN